MSYIETEAVPCVEHVGATTDVTSRPHGWIEGRTIRAASDVGLGVVLLATGAVALVTFTGMDLGRMLPPGQGHIRPGPEFFPTVVGWMLLAVGVAELLRGVFLREPARDQCADKHYAVQQKVRFI